MSIGSWLKDMVYPRGFVCCVCDRISRGSAICRRCDRELKLLKLGDEICPRCGSPLRRGEDCRCDLPDWMTARSVWRYRGPAAKLVQALKFGDVLDAYDPLAIGVGQAIRELDPQGKAVITWVTMPPSRWRERGYDHAQVIASGAAEWVGRSCEQLLTRIEPRRQLKHQVGLNAAQRAENLKGTFACDRRLTGTVILIDDVFTTGATARQAGECLMQAGADRVIALTATRAMHG